MAEVVVNEVEFGIVVFRTEAERVEGDDVEGDGRVAVRARSRAEGRVVVVRADAVRSQAVEHVDRSHGGVCPTNRAV